MAKGRILGPFWFLIGLGIVTIITHTYSLLLIAAYGRRLDLMYKILFFFWTYVVFFEAIVYWRIRYKNVSPKASWGHVILMGIALVIPVMMYPLAGYFTRRVNGDYLAVVKAMQLGMKVALYGGLFISHVLFIGVLVKARAPRKVEFVEGSENLLDDVD
ncbi:MAG: hypothetical protein JST68_02210 [Bacteroidetes bacterium]|nr:hypothetical protein [Bacteroidota bacterium]